MAISLQISHVDKRYSTLLFEGVNLRAQGNDKIGLIGDNGSGKSTLLKILAGLENVDEGEVIWTKGAKIGYLEQEVISNTFDVSGGEKKILRLTELFYSDYDVLLLDEPDNHLDIEHKDWFKQLVQGFSGLIIVISHDRNFLSESITKTWLLEEKKISDFSFGYAKFRHVYEQNMASRQHLWEVQEKERLRLKDIVERFRVRAAGLGKTAKSYHSAVKRYERFMDSMVEKPPQARKLNLKLDLGKQHRRKPALYIQDLIKNYADLQVLSGVNLHLFYGDKMAISAPNGSGKSTLLNIIVGKLDHDGGTIRIGDGLKLGYYAQEHLDVLDEHATLVEELQKSTSLAYYDAVAYLKRFLFDHNQIKSEVRFLSGGQKSRLQLAKFLATNPDILVLDEPTNHLDLKTVLALENFLKEYAGTLVLVSHDRELVRNAVDRVYELKNGQLVENTNWRRSSGEGV